MRVHFLQHDRDDGPGNMAAPLRARGHCISITRLDRSDPLPRVRDMDWLILLGGDMGVHDETAFPWLVPEKALIRQALQAGIRVLGICLGAQLMAQALGARVTKNQSREIGWFPVFPLPQVKPTFLGPLFSAPFETFHWHDDTFEIPKGALALGSSPACARQGFALGNRIVGLQFHPEVREAEVRAFLETGTPDPRGSAHVQTREQMLARPERFEANARFTAALLNIMEGSGADKDAPGTTAP